MIFHVIVFLFLIFILYGICIDDEIKNKWEQKGFCSQIWNIIDIVNITKLVVGLKCLAWSGILAIYLS